MLLSDPVEKLNGIGPKRKAALASLGIVSVFDLLFHMPMRYEDRRTPTSIDRLVPDKPALVRGTLENISRRKAHQREKLWITTAEVRDPTGSIEVVWFGGWANDMTTSEGREIILCGTPTKNARSIEFASPEFKILPDDPNKALLPDAEWNRIVPIYPTTEGLPRKWLARIIYECITSPDLTVEETIPKALLAKRDLPLFGDSLRGIHNPTSRQEIVRGRKGLVYREFFALQQSLLEARARRASNRSPSLAAGNATLAFFLQALHFELTPSQTDALNEISVDLDRELPMRRLLQGDVGSGKTVVALGAAAKALGAGYQVAILAPTTILSGQLHGACQRHLAPLGFPCLEMTGGMSAADKKNLLARAKKGEPFVLTGTHALLEESLVIENLGLAIVDEQHRFGVMQRSLLKGKNDRAHMLMMSATPIPRSLCLALYGDIDSSVIGEKPRGRHPVATRIVDLRRVDEVYRFIGKKIAAGDRCYWVCPLIGDEDDGVLFRMKNMARHLPKVDIAALHGGMSSNEKRGIMARFASGEVQAIVSTTVIEVGLDVAEANVIVVESASRFGLSQLHQLRGRVGRGERQGVCLLLDDMQKGEGAERLSILEKTDDGFAIAEADLKLRGAGELTGLRQHGETGLRIADIVKDARLLEWARDDVASLHKNAVRT